MVFEQHYKIGTEDIGDSYMATNRALIAMMEDVGSLQSASVGYGVLDIETKQKAWVLLDWDVKVIRRPIYNETILAKTWATQVEKACAYRDAQLCDASGKVVAIASTRWILMDLNKRRPIRLTDELMDLYKPEPNRNVFDEKMQEIRTTEEIVEKCRLGERIQFVVQRRDIDGNQHMHNLSYLDAAYEVLPQDIYDGCQFNRIRISYKKEIQYHDKVDCVYVKEGQAHTVYMVGEDKVHAVIILKEE